MDVLDWLADWYEAQCDGDWEHDFGPSIGTIDNPGWSIKIELAGTDCDGRILDRVWHNREHQTDWWTCWTEDNIFHGTGGPLTLRSLLETFRDWTANVPYGSVAVFHARALNGQSAPTVGNATRALTGLP